VQPEDGREPTSRTVRKTEAEAPVLAAGIATGRDVISLHLNSTQFCQANKETLGFLAEEVPRTAAG